MPGCANGCRGSACDGWRTAHSGQSGVAAAAAEGVGQKRRGPLAVAGRPCRPPRPTAARSACRRGGGDGGGAAGGRGAVWASDLGPPCVPLFAADPRQAPVVLRPDT